MDHVVLGARVEFAHHGVGQQLLDTKRLAVAHETGNRNSADVLWQSTLFPAV